jgi:hypothetical protein
LGLERPSAASLSPWADSVVIVCRDKDKQGRNKCRRVPVESVVFGMDDGVPEVLVGCRAAGVGEAESGFPLASKTPGANMLLKGYGNAIVPQVAALFVEEFIELMKGGRNG